MKFGKLLEDHEHQWITEALAFYREVAEIHSIQKSCDNNCGLCKIRSTLNSEVCEKLAVRTLQNSTETPSNKTCKSQTFPPKQRKPNQTEESRYGSDSQAVAAKIECQKYAIQKAHSRNNTNEVPKKCTFCHLVHKPGPKYCSAYGQTCSNCSKKNHTAEACRRKFYNGGLKSCSKINKETEHNSETESFSNHETRKTSKHENAGNKESITLESAEGPEIGKIIPATTEAEIATDKETMPTGVTSSHSCMEDYGNNCLKSTSKTEEESESDIEDSIDRSKDETNTDERSDSDEEWVLNSKTKKKYNTKKTILWNSRHNKEIQQVSEKKKKSLYAKRGM